ncbi:hypothetical protein [Aidingimonas halophila]|uniref:Uncharacterized protein n=1 Tax=Aidingimonas halophila TaxID=574349 RepID=A0A1H3G7I7_9GAMM|nr:hypothetical protein [Aidingimonas halophila]GHC32545.1 hypothetical protein GCM10008094_26540 [Aidingimonas halophila]SDX98319.1 hypothetical protein SAMN05443545_10911 [Aidingimonas halophila]
MKSMDSTTTLPTDKVKWVTPELIIMRIDATLSGGKNVPGESMSGQPNSAGNDFS